MPLFARSKQELVIDVLEDLSKSTNLTRLSTGSFVRAIVDSVMERLEEAYDIFDLNLARAFVSAANGQYLDLIGDLFGITREPSKAAGADELTQVVRFYVESGTFGSINASADILVPQGTVISTAAFGGGVSYRLLDDVLLSASDSEQWIAVEASAPGEESNVGKGELRFHSFSTYQDYENGTLLVVNDYQIANGSALESDDNFRYRIVNKSLEAEAANETAIRLAALTVPGVANVILIPRYRGLGTFGLIVKSVTPTVSDALLALVEVNVARVKSVGSVAYIVDPKETGVSLKVTVHYSERLPENEYVEIEQTLKSTISDFIEGLDIGQEFFVNRLASQLFAVDDRVTNLGEPGKPFDEVYIWKSTKLKDNRVRQILLGDYIPKDDERVIVEPSVSSFVTFERAFTRR